MRQIEEYISPLIEGQFPAFYRDEGQLFVAFVKAYYEWAESNLQLLTFEDSTDFNNGDTITQGQQTGTILAVYDTFYLVQLNQFEQFKCNTLCNDLTICTSSSGGSSYILSARSFNHEYLGRKLVDIKDIDRTIEKFIISFKNKYLPDIQFNTASNKRLFIKNSLDFYRAKGTERAVDLFFKLIYALEADVYYPGDDIFKLSDNEFVNVQYLEVLNSPDNVQFVGQSIVGADSGAEAYVDRLIRVRKGSRFIEVMHLSNVSGSFQTNEQITTTSLDTNYITKMIGSLSAAQVALTDEGHNVGDDLSVLDGNGKKAKLRVTETEDITGLVRFKVLNDGWGYSSSAEVLGSDQVIRLGDVNVTNQNWFYDNQPFRQFETIQQDLVSFTANTSNLVEFVANSIFVPSVDDEVTAVDEVDNDIFKGTVVVSSNQTFTVEYRAIDWNNNTAIEAITSLTADTLDANGDIVSTNTATVNSSSIVTSDIISNSEIVFVYDGANTEFQGTVVSSNTSTGVVIVNYNGETYSNDSVITSVTELKNTGNTQTMNVISVSIVNATANVIACGETSTIQYTQSDDILLSRGDIIYQLNDRGSEYANSVVILATEDFEAGSFVVDVERLTGSFRTDRPFYRKSDNVEYSINTFSNTNIGVINVTNTFYPAANVYGLQSGTHSSNNVISTFLAKANFSVQSRKNTEEYYNFYANDLISSANLDLTINSSSYGLSGNASLGFTDTIADALSYSNVEIGSIDLILTTSAGELYLADPFYVIHDPKSRHLERYDLIIQYSDLEKNFQETETIEGATSGAKAVITRHDRPNRTIYATRITLPTSTFPTITEAANTDITDFTVGETITGLNTNISATLSYVNERRREDRVGLNADISSPTFSGNGYITAVKIIDSGFGYQDGERVTASLDRDTTKISSFDLSLGKQGIAPGYFTSRKGFLSSDKYLHDNDFYQEYSYQVLTSLPFDVYKKTLVDVLHVAGTKPFGKYVGTTITKLGIDISTEVSDFEIGKIDVFFNESTFYEHRVVPTFRPGLFDFSGDNSFFTANVDHVLHPPSLENEQTFSTARIYTLLEPPAIASSESFFTLDVRPTLHPETLTDDDTFFAPEFRATIRPTLINNTQTFETIDLRYTLRPSLFENVIELVDAGNASTNAFAQTIDGGQANTEEFEDVLIAGTSILQDIYPPVVDEGFIRPSLIDTSNQFFASNLVGGLIYVESGYVATGYVSENGT